MQKTKVGNLEVYDSKIVHVTEESGLSIIIDELTILFSFTKDKEAKERIKREIVDETTLKIVCNSFNNPLGEGILIPLEIGVLRGRKLYMSFFVWTPDLSQERRIINYCLYLEEDGK